MRLDEKLVKAFKVGFCGIRGQIVKGFKEIMKDLGMFRNDIVKLDRNNFFRILENRVVR